MSVPTPMPWRLCLHSHQLLPLSLEHTAKHTTSPLACSQVSGAYGGMRRGWEFEIFLQFLTEKSKSLWVVDEGKGLRTLTSPSQHFPGSIFNILCLWSQHLAVCEAASL